MTEVELRGVRRPEIMIEVPEAELRKYAITLGDVAAAVRKTALDMPAGGIKAETGSPFFLASITKMFTCAVIMRLYEDRKLDIDDTIAKY